MLWGSTLFTSKAAPVYTKTCILGKPVNIFMADVLHQFAQKASLINHRVRHVKTTQHHKLVFSVFQLFITQSALTVSVPS